MTAAPSSRAAFAVASPIPELPPRTTTVAFFKDMLHSILLVILVLMLIAVVPA